MELGLTEKKVLVTGASRGIGLAVAEGFLKEGAKVVMVSRGSKQLIDNVERFKEQYGDNNVYTYRCDCTDESSVSVLLADIKENIGDLDIIIANVGDGRSVNDPLPEKDNWDRCWKNNFDATLFVSRKFLPMLQVTKGSLLFVSSITAIEAFGAPVDYSTAKSAINALAKNMARKLAGEVRVNVLAPGNVYFSGGSWDEKIQKSPEQVRDIIKSTVPMNRFGTPEEMANAALFLCSDRAKFITGSTLVVDGGQTVGIF